MALITIRELKTESHNAILSFDNTDEYPLTISDPFAPEDEARLEWYFEEHLQFPFIEQVKAQEAAQSIVTYGHALFEQMFRDKRAFARYKEEAQEGLNTLAFEIAGSPDFHRLHWEALKDPDLPRAFALDAPMVRKNLVPQTMRANVRESPTLNLLVVTSRPHGVRDVGYRTISRPLVEAVRQTNVPARIDFVRPGTYHALVEHLESARDHFGAGHYHVIHFDVHGGVLTHTEFHSGIVLSQFLNEGRYGRKKIGAYEGHKAFLFLESDVLAMTRDPVEASELAELLTDHQVPIVILNACQSGKQIGARETSLGSRLMQAGVQMALAMGYSITVSAAELLMRHLYEQLFAGQELSIAIRRARLELANQKGRRAYFNQMVNLEDWLLPVVYQNQPQRLTTRAMSRGERAAFFEREAKRYQPREPVYGFVGRDLDILNVERGVLTQRNILLVRGMGGAGKTTLLHHLGAWWQTTNLVNQVFYFGWDERAWNRQQIMHTIANALFDAREIAEFLPLGLDAQQALLARRLRAKRHLLILDNLESITGAQLAIQHTLPADEQNALHRFLRDLADGQTIVLLGSRGGEAWLVEGTFGDNVYELAGLDPEAASTLADWILTKIGATKYRGTSELAQLLKLLNGYPLAIQVVLENLARQTPADVLKALQAGDVSLDSGDLQDKTASILHCIEYSFSNLSPEAQDLLMCLAPFTLVINVGRSGQYTEQLRQQPSLAYLAFDRWREVLQEAIDWGLLAPHPQSPDCLQIHPVFPYFLRARLNTPELNEMRRAIETAFRQHYDSVGNEVAILLDSKDAQKKQLGQARVNLEYENLVAALNYTLDVQFSILRLYAALSSYLDAIQDQQRGLELGETVLTRLSAYPEDKLTGQLGAEFPLVLGDIATRQLALKQFETAEATYKKALRMLLGNRSYEGEKLRRLSAGIYHQLGRVAQEQRQWVQAEQYYKQALQILIEVNDRYSQATTYHQLGSIAREQRQWAQAEQYYKQALQILIEFNDRYSQASTYHELGWVAQEQQQWTQAEQYYKQALEIYSYFNERYRLASTYHQLGMVTAKQRRWAQSEQYHKQALQIRIEFNDRYSQALSLHALGTVIQEQHQLKQAEEYYKQALQIYIEFNDRFWQAGAYHQLGMVAQAQRQWVQAEQYYKQALQIFVEFNDFHAQGSTYHKLGTLAQEHRQWAQAEQYYKQALQNFIEANDRYSQASTYNNLGLIAEGEAHWTQARAYYHTALHIWVEFSDYLSSEIALRNLAFLWLTSGDNSILSEVANALGMDVKQAEERMRRALK